MADSVVGRGVIELVGDARKLQASISEAKKSIRTLGEGQKDISAKASQSIDQYIGRLQAQNAMLGKSTREVELYKLALRGASNEQLAAANATLKFAENQKATAAIFSRINTGMIVAAAAATAMTGGLIAMVASAINAADHLNDLNKTTGISVENLSGLALAAKQSGGDLDGIAASISKLSQNIGKDGEKFKALGITAKDPLEAFKQLADIFAAIEDPQTRAALGAAALGKSWMSAAPLLAEGGRNIGEMVEKGAKLSGVTKQLAEESDKLNDQLAEMRTAANGLGAKMAAEMVGPLTSITKAIMEAYQESGKLSALWVSMGSIGAFLFTDEFSSNTVKLQGVNKELAILHKRQKDIEGSGSIMRSIFGADKLDEQVRILEATKAAIQKAMLPSPRAPVKTQTDQKIAAAAAAFIKDKPAKTAKTGATKDTAAAEWKELSAQWVKALDQIEALERAEGLAENAGRSWTQVLQVGFDEATKAQEAFTKAREDAAAQNAIDVEQIRVSLLSPVAAEQEAFNSRLVALTDFSLARVENEGLASRLIEAEAQAHAERMLAIKQAEQEQQLAIMGSATNQLYGLMKQAGLEQTALGKAGFIASKAIAVAEILMNAEKGAAVALGMGPFGIPMATIIRAMGYASAGMVTGMTIAEVAGGKAAGGPVDAGKAYRVNERGPELLNTGGKQYLMMGGQGGSVTPNDKLGGITIINHTTGRIDRASYVPMPSGERAILIEEAVNATAAQFSDPNSKTSRAMGRSYSVQRSR